MSTIQIRYINVNIYLFFFWSIVKCFDNVECGLTIKVFVVRCL